MIKQPYVLLDITRLVPHLSRTFGPKKRNASLKIGSNNKGAGPYGNYIAGSPTARLLSSSNFFLGSKDRRRASLAKIDRLIDTLTDFRVRLRKEADLIETYRPLN